MNFHMTNSLGKFLMTGTIMYLLAVSAVCQIVESDGDSDEKGKIKDEFFRKKEFF